MRNLHLSYGSHILYAIDSNAANLQVIWTYEDTLAAPVVLTSPIAAEGLDSTGTISFSWEDLNSDTVNIYQIQVNEEEDFPGATDESVGTVEQDGTAGADQEYQDDTSVTWRDEAAAGTEYFWRVRVGGQIYEGPGAATDTFVGGPLLSRWSVASSLTTKVGRAGGVTDVAPSPGAQNIVLSPALSWGRVTGADFYEVEIATDPDFTSVVDSGTAPSEVYLLSTELDYATTYYWRVRGVSFSGAPEASWRNSIFTTMAAPVKAAPPVVVEPTPPAPEQEDIVLTIPKQPTPGYVWVMVGMGVLVVIGLIVLTIRTRRV